MAAILKWQPFFVGLSQLAYIKLFSFLDKLKIRVIKGYVYCVNIDAALFSSIILKACFIDLFQKFLFIFIV